MSSSRPVPALVAVFALVLATFAFAWPSADPGISADERPEALVALSGQEVRVVLISRSDREAVTQARGTLVGIDATGLRLQSENVSTWIPYTSMREVSATK